MAAIGWRALRRSVRMGGVATIADFDLVRRGGHRSLRDFQHLVQTAVAEAWELEDALTALIGDYWGSRFGVNCRQQIHR